MRVISENFPKMVPLKYANRRMTSTRAAQKPQVNIPTTRSRSTVVTATSTKRKADSSPGKQNGKRTAFGDITTTINVTEDKKKTTAKPTIKKAVAQIKTLPSVRTVVKPKQNENVPPPHAPCIDRIVTRAAAHKNVVPNQTALKPKETLKDAPTTNKIKTRLSNEFEKTDESIYSSALEELSDSFSSSGSKGKKERNLKSDEPTNEINNVSVVSMVAQQLETKLNLGVHDIPEGIVDFDKENWEDTFQVSHYAMDIFNYMRTIEPIFDIPDYMDRQICLSTWMRSLLVDWMVEVQESFELNHETLYLGVKLVDLYLSRMTVGKETLQLVGAAAMFVASKYDERIPPAINDFLYICDGAYTRGELVRMEINLLKVCDFNLGIPLSYRFLRRYARCAKVTMPVLTLARYILEHSLMEYATVTVRDSLLAAAGLYLALRMRKISEWTPTLKFYSGYDLKELKSVVILLNESLHKKPKHPLMTVRNKYSHKVFYEVANTPVLTKAELFD